MAERGREHWVKVVAELEQSGLEHRDFASRNAVSIHSLRSWLYRLRREGRKSPRRKAPKRRALRMVPVRVRHEPSTVEHSALELVIDGTRLRFLEGTSVQYVAELARALRA